MKDQVADIDGIEVTAPQGGSLSDGPKAKIRIVVGATGIKTERGGASLNGGHRQGQNEERKRTASAAETGIA